MNNNEKQKYQAVFDKILIAIDQTNERISELAVEFEYLNLSDGPDIEKLSGEIKNIVKDLK